MSEIGKLNNHQDIKQNQPHRLREPKRSIHQETPTGKSDRPFFNPPWLRQTGRQNGVADGSFGRVPSSFSDWRSKVPTVHGRRHSTGPCCRQRKHPATAAIDFLFLPVQNRFSVGLYLSHVVTTLRATAVRLWLGGYLGYYFLVHFCRVSSVQFEVVYRRARGSPYALLPVAGNECEKGEVAKVLSSLCSSVSVSHSVGPGSIVALYS